MNPATETILSLSDHSGASTGPWFAIDPQPKTHIPLQIEITGTAEVIFEGRIGPAEAAVPINTFTASGGVLGAHFPQIRARVVSATSATIVARVGGVARVVS